MRNHRKLADIYLKEKATLEELNEIKNLFISEGREPTAEEERKMERLRERLNNYTRIKEIWLSGEGEIEL